MYVYRALNNFTAGAVQIVWSNLFLLGHIPFLKGQTLIMSYPYKSEDIFPWASVRKPELLHASPSWSPKVGSWSPN